jgi:hypothetical protein
MQQDPYRKLEALHPAQGLRQLHPQFQQQEQLEPHHVERLPEPESEE